MAITVRRLATHGNPPIYSNDETSRAFVEVVLGMDFDELCLKYEAYAMCGLQGMCTIVWIVHILNVVQVWRKTITRGAAC